MKEANREVVESSTELEQCLGASGEGRHCEVAFT